MNSQRGSSIALVTSEVMPKSDPEIHFLVEALARIGVSSEIVPWDAKVDWSLYKTVVVKSPWDYFDRLKEFLEWIENVSAISRILNPIEVIRWNARKDYLLILQENGIPILPSIFLKAGAPPPWESMNISNTEEYVMKPTVGIGAIGTSKGYFGTNIFREQVSELLKRGDVVLQPFAESVVRRGEVSLVYFGGEYSHAVRKIPASGDFRVQNLHGGTVEPYIPADVEISVANDAINQIPADTAYARIDLIEWNEHPAVMEIEAIEPELFLGYDPNSSSRFARVIAQSL